MCEILYIMYTSMWQSLRKILWQKKKRGKYISVSFNLTILALCTSILTFLFIQNFLSVSLPCDFAAWDKNGDGYIDMKEFSSVAYLAVEDGELGMAFEATDTDGMSTHQ